MKLQLATADPDIEHDEESVQASGLTTPCRCHTPDESTILQYSEAFNGAKKRPSDSFAKRPETSTSGEFDFGESKFAEPGLEETRFEESRPVKSKPPGKWISDELQPIARIRSQARRSGEQFANYSRGFIPYPSLNFAIGPLPLNVWAILGLISALVAMYYVYVTSSSTGPPVTAVWLHSSTLWGALRTCWDTTYTWALEHTVCLFPMTAILSRNSFPNELVEVQTKEMVNFDHTAGLFIQAAYSSLAGDEITQELDLQHDFVSTILMGISQNYLPEPEGIYAALHELDNDIIPAALDGLYDFFPAVRNSESLTAGESRAPQTRPRQTRNKGKGRWLGTLGGSNWSASQEQEFRALLRKLCDRVDSIITPRERESVQVKSALQNMKAKISSVRDQMLHNQHVLQSSENEKRDQFLRKWRFSDSLQRISSSIENLGETQNTVSKGATVVANIINFVGGIRGEMRALRAIANSADLQFGEESIDGLISSLESALNAFHGRLNSKAQPQIGS
ncbi:hypothetical protein F5B17DRAFT_424930 [Nemania serpens]|nr:hypothetical protein F5B17DRAFT_424930 [Nemania serpens]